MKLASSMCATMIGGIAGAIAGFIGEGVLTGILYGSISAGMIGFVFSSLPRAFGDAPVAVESFPFAGFIGGVFGSFFADAGFIGAFISCGAGWVLGLFLPAILVAAIMPRED